MKIAIKSKSIKTFIFITVIASVIIIAGFNTTRAKKRMDVLDYYLLLPAAYFGCEMMPDATKKYRLKQIVKKNIRNGYIKAKSEGYPMEVALFRDSKLKLDVIAVSISCGAGCMCNKFDLLQLTSAGKWNNLTAKIFPSEDAIIKSSGKKGDIVLQYRLPEYGVEIKAMDDASKKVIQKIKWSGGQFILP